jgi:hypothetical protein
MDGNQKEASRSRKRDRTGVKNLYRKIGPAATVTPRRGDGPVRPERFVRSGAVALLRRSANWHTNPERKQGAASGRPWNAATGTLGRPSDVLDASLAAG